MPNSSAWPIRSWSHQEEEPEEPHELDVIVKIKQAGAGKSQRRLAIHRAHRNLRID